MLIINIYLNFFLFSISISELKINDNLNNRNRQSLFQIIDETHSKYEHPDK
jgi:hypothetical protein